MIGATVRSPDAVHACIGDAQYQWQSPGTRASERLYRVNCAERPSAFLAWATADCAARELVKRVAYSTRALASGLRNRMNQLAEQKKEGPTANEAIDARNHASGPVKGGNGHADATRNVVASQEFEDAGEREQIIPEARADHAPLAHEVAP